MLRLATIGSTALLLVAGAATAATPEDAIKYRQAVMMTAAGHVGAISLLVGGKVEHPSYLLGHAEALAQAGEQMEKIFPAGSGAGKTDALPRIWQEPAEFQKALTAARTSTAQLRDAIKGGDKAAIGKAMKPVFDSCKGCHDRFRKEQ